MVGESCSAVYWTLSRNPFFYWLDVLVSAKKPIFFTGWVRLHHHSAVVSAGVSSLLCDEYFAVSVNARNVSVNDRNVLVLLIYRTLVETYLLSEVFSL